MSTRKFVLHDSEFKQRCIEAIWKAPEGWEVLLRPEKRTLEQNAKFHAICSDIESFGMFFAGRYRTFDEIKTLLVSGHAEATKDEFGTSAELLQGLEGELVVVRESTAQMSKKRSSSLIEYTLAFCAQKGIKLWESIKPKRAMPKSENKRAELKVREAA